MSEVVAAVQAAQAQVYHRSTGGERLTPDWIVERAIKTLGGIDLDPCAESSGPPFNVTAKVHYTERDDGLAREWLGTVYMNPPYGKHRKIHLWIDKLISEHRAGRMHSAIALLPARVGTIWWRKLRDFPVCFLYGRVKFVGFDTGAGFPSSVHYLGTNCERFHWAWSDVGDIWQRVKRVDAHQWGDRQRNRLHGMITHQRQVP